MKKQKETFLFLFILVPEKFKKMEKNREDKITIQRLSACYVNIPSVFYR